MNKKFPIMFFFNFIKRFLIAKTMKHKSNSNEKGLFLYKICDKKFESGKD